VSQTQPEQGPVPDRELAIERWFPELRGRFPRVPFTSLPTRVHRLQRLAGELGLDELWIKRDDESGQLYGGNKPRKLEFVLADALAQRRTAVLTFGGIGTHHGLATTLCARSVGLRSILLLLQQPVTEHVRECLLLNHAAGAELHYGSGVRGVALGAARVCVRELLRGRFPYILPTGGSSALGTLGYVNAAFELYEQICARELPEPECIFVPLGSGGTVAGLVLGAKLVGLRSRIMAVLVTDIMPPTPQKLAKQAAACLALLQKHVPDLRLLRVAADDFTIVPGYVGAGYGAPTDVARRARDVAARLEGIQLETTYSAKCMAALIDAAERREYRDGPVLFWNTYSSVDPRRQLPLPDYTQLPPAFHRFFTGALVPA
jgi:D-cysteine desulfhydrase